MVRMPITWHISRRVYFLINGEKCRIHKIDWCEGVLKLANIETRNVGEDDLNPIMKYNMVMLDN